MTRRASGVRATALDAPNSGESWAAAQAKVTINVVLESESHPVAQPKRRGRPPKMRSVIPNSDDMDWDEDPPSAKESSSPPVKQVLKGVVIPTSNRTSIGSSLSSVRDQSSGYDTPATSAVATPAESLVKERTIGVPVKVSGRLGGGKRKRSEAVDQLEADAALARSLQEMEYDEEPKLGRRSRGARQGLIHDSDEEVDDPVATSGLFTANTSDADVPLSRRTEPDRLAPFPPPRRPHGDAMDDDDDDDAIPRRKRVKPTLRASLPSRAARASATKSLKDSGSRRILDSDDSELSELSDASSDASMFASEVDSDDMEDSDEVGGDGVEGAEENVLETMAGSSTLVANATTTPTGRRGRRRGQGQNNDRSRQRRRFRNRYFDSRVSKIGIQSTLQRLMNARRSESATSSRLHTQRSKLCGKILRPFPLFGLPMLRNQRKSHANSNPFNLRG